MVTAAPGADVAAEAPAGPAPAGAALPCPLCEYDLRGQSDPRCPECGYRFTWEELTDPARRLHPYLFEHHPERPARAFRRTLVGGLRPRRFWDTLFPTQPSRPKRLIAYWLLAATPLLLSLVACHVLFVAKVGRERLQQRSNLATWTPAMIEDVARAYGSAEEYLDLTYPMPTSARFYRGLYGHGVGPALWVVLLWLAWPWLTVLTLQVFQVSMRRARVRPVHVLRCVLYSFDTVFWVGLLFAGGIAARYYLASDPYDAYFRWPGVLGSILPTPWEPGADALFAGGVVLTAVAAYRVVIAFRKYLRFDHPVATVFVSQFIVLLVMVIVSSLRVQL